MKQKLKEEKERLAAQSPSASDSNLQNMSGLSASQLSIESTVTIVTEDKRKKLEEDGGAQQGSGGQLVPCCEESSRGEVR